MIDKRTPRAAENFWEDQGRKPEPPASFVPLRVVDTATNSAEKDGAADCRLKIETPSGFLVSVEAVSVQFFAKVIRALGGLSAKLATLDQNLFVLAKRGHATLIRRAFRFDSKSLRTESAVRSPFRVLQQEARSDENFVLGRRRVCVVLQET